MAQDRLQMVRWKPNILPSNASIKTNQVTRLVVEIRVVAVVAVVVVVREVEIAVVEAAVNKHIHQQTLQP